MTACTPLATTTGLASADTARLCVQFYKNTEPWLYILLFTKTLLHSSRQLIRSSALWTITSLLPRHAGTMRLRLARWRTETTTKIVKISKNHDATPIHAKCIEVVEWARPGGGQVWCGLLLWAGPGQMQGRTHIAAVYQF